MKVIDLTHTITEDMPVYPGTEQPRLTPANSYDKDGFRETLIRMYSHTGTHIDPPAHIFPEGRTLDSFPPEQFLGRRYRWSAYKNTASRRRRRIFCSLTPATTAFGEPRRTLAITPALAPPRWSMGGRGDIGRKLLRQSKAKKAEKQTALP